MIRIKKRIGLIGFVLFLFSIWLFLNFYLASGSEIGSEKV